MNSKEILIFDLQSEYGHFRKYNTTTSPLTYSIPTRTAIAGILGAILGMERELSDGVYPIDAEPVQEYFSKDRSDIAVQIISPIKKEYVSFNLIKTSSGSKDSFFNISEHTQIRYELLKDVHFRIYLAMEDNAKFEELLERIVHKRHHFTPYLGLAQFTTQVDFVQKATVQQMQGNGMFTDIITAVNMSKLLGEPPVEFQREFFYSANNMPITMNREREVLEYSEVLIEKNGNPLMVKVSDYYIIDGVGNILFL